MSKKDFSPFSRIVQTARKVIENEYLAIKNLLNSPDEDFVSAVNMIYNSKGRVIVTGIGKSAIISEKIVATLNSTGTPAIFMHAADAVHGDLGIIRPDDIVMCLSKSGNTPEIKVLVPFIRSFGNKIIAMVSETDSFLSHNADVVIRASVDKEACPNNLAPTSSSTAQLVMGDALAVCLLEERSFSERDFAKYHPGGALGKKLYMRVKDLYVNNEKPQVSPESKINEVIIEISAKRLGATAVVEGKNNKLAGIITDGDLRRMLQAGLPEGNIKAIDIMSEKPRTISPETLAISAFEKMKANSITQLLVCDKDSGEYLGVLHLHDILREGIF